MSVQCSACSHLVSAGKRLRQAADLIKLPTSPGPNGPKSVIVFPPQKRKKKPQQQRQQAQPCASSTNAFTLRSAIRSRRFTSCILRGLAYPILIMDWPRLLRLARSFFGTNGLLQTSWAGDADTEAAISALIHRFVPVDRQTTSPPSTTALRGELRGTRPPYRRYHFPFGDGVNARWVSMIDWRPVSGAVRLPPKVSWERPRRPK